MNFFCQLYVWNIQNKKRKFNWNISCIMRISWIFSVKKIFLLNKLQYSRKLNNLFLLWCYIDALYTENKKEYCYINYNITISISSVFIFIRIFSDFFLVVSYYVAKKLFYAQKVNILKWILNLFKMEKNQLQI